MHLWQIQVNGKKYSLQKTKKMLKRHVQVWALEAKLPFRKSKGLKVILTKKKKKDKNVQVLLFDVDKFTYVQYAVHWLVPYL